MAKPAGGPGNPHGWRWTSGAALRKIRLPPQAALCCSLKRAMRKAIPVKKGTNNKNRGKTSRHRAKLKQKHKKARKRMTGGARSTYR